jgi:hypothetical protein
MGEGGLRDVELVGGPGEVAVAGDRLGVDELAQLDLINRRSRLIW